MKSNSNAGEGASRRAFLKTSAAVVPTAILGELSLPAVHAAGTGIIKVGVIGCGGRGEAAAMNAMNAGKDIHIVAMADIRLDRVQEKRSALKLKYPDQVTVDDDHCFKGFDAYHKRDRKLGCRDHRECRQVPPAAFEGRDRGRQARLRRKAARHRSVRDPHGSRGRRDGQDQRALASCRACRAGITPDTRKR